MKSFKKIMALVAALVSSTAIAGSSDGGYGKSQDESANEAQIEKLEQVIQSLYEANAIEIGADNKLRVKRDIVKELIAQGRLKSNQAKDSSICH